MTAPSRAGSRNLFECQLVASAPVSASPSPITQQTKRSGLSNTAPNACSSEYPSSPPSWMEPGVWRHMAGDDARKRELFEEPLHPRFVLRNPRVDFAVRPFQ